MKPNIKKIFTKNLGLKIFSFLLALISGAQKKVIQINPNIRYVGEANVDIDTLTLLVKDGMHILSNPNITKDIS